MRQTVIAPRTDSHFQKLLSSAIEPAINASFAQSCTVVCSFCRVDVKCEVKTMRLWGGGTLIQSPLLHEPDVSLSPLASINVSSYACKQRARQGEVVDSVFPLCVSHTQRALCWT